MRGVVLTASPPPSRLVRCFCFAVCVLQQGRSARFGRVRARHERQRRWDLQRAAASGDEVRARAYTLPSALVFRLR